MPPEMLFDDMVVHLNGPNAAGKKIALNMSFTGFKKMYALIVENGVLNYCKKPVHRPDAKITFSNAALDATRLKEKTLEQATVSGELKIEGRKESFAQFMGLLDSASFRVNIVTP